MSMAAQPLLTHKLIPANYLQSYEIYKPFQIPSVLGLGKIRYSARLISWWVGTEESRSGK
jgi:hypothetical protein